MPVTPCVNARDSIDQSAGLVLGNHFDYPDPLHTVTSYCRTIDGTWIAWRNEIDGDQADGSIGDPNKPDWPAHIASANAVGVGFFPDDGTAPIVYELSVDPTYDWAAIGDTALRDPCSLWGFTGDHYADNPQSLLLGWQIGLIDVQVRTDGTNVWVISLAREAVKYPFLYNSPTEIDRCGHVHPTFEEYWASGHSDPFVHDSDSGTRWWYYSEGLLGGEMPFGPYDDPGPHLSFRWQPARVTVWAGDIGGFTKLDTIEAQFDNQDGTSGLCAGVEASASQSEPGVLHVLWSEGGEFGTQTFDQKRGQRINYSRWDFTSKTLDTDLAYIEESGTGFVSSEAWVFTGEMIIRNDHGSPVAIAWRPDTDGVSRFYSGAVEFWDLSSGTVNVLQTADLSLAPTGVEGNDGGFPETVFGNIVNANKTTGSQNIKRSQFVSSPYIDPLLGNTDVYLLCVGYGQESNRSGCKAFLRIPCDGSATFDYLDGTRLTNFSIIPGGSFIDVFSDWQFAADFVSDSRNLWMPANIDAGGGVLHLTRVCERTWELLPAWPDKGDGSGFETGEWGSQATVQPPELLTDDTENDWLVGGGEIAGNDHSGDPTQIAAVRAKICRCCVPCLERVGLHIWETA